MKSQFTTEFRNIHPEEILHNCVTQTLYGFHLVKTSIKKNSVLLFLLFFACTSHGQDVFVGLTSNGGPDGGGTAFSIKNNGTNFSIINAFDNWGRTPSGNLIIGDDGNFYGMSAEGGAYGHGTIFKLSSAGSITILRSLDFTTDGGSASGSLVQASNGNFYGLTKGGGAHGAGTIFKITPSGTYTVMHDFNFSSDGGGPYGHLVIGNDGNFYGVTYSGGSFNRGTIFKITPAGDYSVIRHMNTVPDGEYFRNSLVKGSNGNFYGITYSGGSYSDGTIFRITPAGDFKVLHHMNSPSDGGNSWSTLTEGKDGNFYGMTINGGSNNEGTIFKMAPSGDFDVIHDMDYSIDGGSSRGSLMLNSDGNFLGVASSGGGHAYGTIFKVTPSGTLTVLRDLTYDTDGGNPWGALVKGSDNNFYGTASKGGANGDGTIFKISLTKKFTNLVNFDGANLGNNPCESLIRGTDGAYYGTTNEGGKNGYGTVFKICGNKITLLHSFNGSADGSNPKGSLVRLPTASFMV